MLAVRCSYSVLSVHKYKTIYLYPHAFVWKDAIDLLLTAYNIQYVSPRTIYNRPDPNRTVRYNFFLLFFFFALFSLFFPPFFFLWNRFRCVNCGNIVCFIPSLVSSFILDSIQIDTVSLLLFRLFLLFFSFLPWCRNVRHAQRGVQSSKHQNNGETVLYFATFWVLVWKHFIQCELRLFDNQTMLRYVLQWKCFLPINFFSSSLSFPLHELFPNHYQ